MGRFITMNKAEFNQRNSVYNGYFCKLLLPWPLVTHWLKASTTN